MIEPSSGGDTFSSIDATALATMNTQLAANAEDLTTTAVNLQREFEYYGIATTNVQTLQRIADWLTSDPSTGLPMLRRRQSLAAALDRQDPTSPTAAVPDWLATLTTAQASSQGAAAAAQLLSLTTKPLSATGTSQSDEDQDFATLTDLLNQNSGDPDFATGFLNAMAAQSNGFEGDPHTAQLLAQLNPAFAQLSATYLTANGGDLAKTATGTSAMAMVATLSPSDVSAWWTTLPASTQNQLATNYPDTLGSLDGIPAVMRDQINRKLLNQKIASVQQQVNDFPADRINLYSARNAQKYQNPAYTSIVTELAALTSLKAQLNVSGSVLMTPDHQPLGPSDTTFSAKMPPLYLLHFDTIGNGHVIMAAGDPDTAKNVVTYVPGLGTTLSTHMTGNDIPHAENLYLQAKQQDPNASVASIFWLGYDAPVLGGGKTGLLNSLNVASTSNAQAGAPVLTKFLDGIRATNTTGSPQHLTALGHSYGSLVVGEAAKQPGGIPVDDIIFVGSPGVSVNSASDLNIDPAHVWAGAASNDPVPQLNATATDVGDAFLDFAPELFGGNDTDGGWFGENPANAKFGGNVFAVAAGGNGGLPSGMNAHGEYFDPDKRGDGADQQSLDNMASIIISDYSKVQ